MREIFEELYRGIFIYSQSFCQNEVAEEIFFHILFDGVMVSKPAHYLLDYLFILNTARNRKTNDLFMFFIYKL